ncbi:hypothetical protein SIO70_19020 [Chitinophaga sancti]|uniref:hypothetical protein n=1 Tax=Chitinophaga sancti TaxID=1004 RepID=UPI002A74E44D|nr:hypothetical protein [Chitinophaga sancti]WPQ60442.1 hypothetical protein SIO70_19020 [Chitinophaga sancti]
MKKLLAIFNGLKFSESTLQYAVKLGVQHDMAVTGIFIEDFIYTGQGIFRSYSEEQPTTEGGWELLRKDKLLREITVEKFETACLHAGVKYLVYRDKLTAVSDLLKESKYADLLIIDASETMNLFWEDSPTRFVREILSRANCPILLVPKKFIDIKSIYWLYDSSPVSIYAFKMFCYIFPLLSILPFKVLAVQVAEDRKLITFSPMVRELIQLHVPHAEFITLYGQPELEIPLFIRKQEPELLIILGAYQRNAFSMFFRTSMADVLTKEEQWPMFIAHNK